MKNEKLYNEWNTKFNQCLELEFSNPEYFKVHHILVPTYSLQIGSYVETVREDVLQQLRQFLVEPEEIPSKSVMLLLSQKAQSLKKEKGRLRSSKLDLLFTDKSILDVRTDTAEHYRDDVLKWSRWLVSKLDKS